MTDWNELRHRARVRLFIAEYPGECAACDGPIVLGDMVGYVDDELLGECCVDDA